MKRVLLASAVVLSCAAGFAIRTLTVGPAAAEARAEQRERDDDRQRWEYAAVTKPQYQPSVRIEQYWIVYFGRERGVQVVDVEAGVGGNAQGRAIARLGEEGWEMVGEGTLEVRPGPGGKDGQSAILFKRRRR